MSFYKEITDFLGIKLPHEHEWTEWEKVQQSELTRTSDKGVVAFNYVQKRKCKICKYVEFDTKRYDYV